MVTYVPAGRPPDPVAFVLPALAGDSGRYNQRLCQYLPAAGLPVLELPMASATRLSRSLSALPDGTVVLLDGQVASAVPEVVVPHSRRLRLAVLVHSPLADSAGPDHSRALELDASERETLRMVSTVVATSPGLARRLIDRHDLDPARVHVARPGTDRAPLAVGTDGVSHLVCVSPLVPGHGQDVLARALASVRDVLLTCDFVGSAGDDPAFVSALRRSLDHRSRLLSPPDLAAVYDAADLVVLPMQATVVTDALARGIPILATDTSPAADVADFPGLLIPADDVAALAMALHRWALDPELRRSLRTDALSRGCSLPTWHATADQLAGVLARLQTAPPEVVVPLSRRPARPTALTT
ncbi:glycosyltransferase family 4 protein [Amycolatopsis sp. NPDC059021]|uniref:glycosyltransferase family 4 protein n=1 Tax=Amycolatopsis sp. NPDC059021 TaxID=3346704 RepID=UPI00367186C9